MAHDMTKLDRCAETFTTASEALAAVLAGPPPSSLQQYQSDTSRLLIDFLLSTTDLVAEIKQAFADLDAHTHDMTHNHDGVYAPAGHTHG